jgi:hypothetical protein
MLKRYWLPSKSEPTNYCTVKVRAASVGMATGLLSLVVAAMVPVIAPTTAPVTPPVGVVPE